MTASKHHGATLEHWSFVMALVTQVTRLTPLELTEILRNPKPKGDDSGNLSGELE
ncbi:MAG: hypothetical protein WBC78_02410 [Candidatus Sulfotelmatobacter sp.]|nr:hypothetical protein [Candidatus Eremiobacteraceae bacterium]